jgi:hypothetical protein
MKMPRRYHHRLTHGERIVSGVNLSPDQPVNVRADDQEEMTPVPSHDEVIWRLSIAINGDPRSLIDDWSQETGLPALTITEALVWLARRIKA